MEIMGVNYQQFCIIGISIPYKDLQVTTSEAIYEEQNRYDPKTGKVVGAENVLVKEREWHVEFNGKKYDDYYDIERDYKDMFSYMDYDCETFYLGLKIETEDFGRADLINESFTPREISDMCLKVHGKLRNYEIGIHFIGYAG
jgi:hypothetical protein